MSKTKALREAVKTIFYPHAESLGFSVDARMQPQFVVFRRVDGGTIQVFDIQWDKYHRPRFVLNFSEAPAGGVEFGGKRYTADDICAVHCGSYLRLQRRRGGGGSCWFQLRRPVIEQLVSLKRDYPPETVASQVVQRFGEIEDWWRDKSIGPHVDDFR